MPRVGMPVPGIDFYDEGVLLARQEKADFKGAGVTGAVAGVGIEETIPGGGGGVTDHGALTGLADDDHTQYLKEEASGGLPSEIPDHLHTGVAEAGTLDHGAALTGLTDDDHTQYQKESEKGAASGYASLGADTKVPAAELGNNRSATVADETTEGIAAAAGAGGEYSDGAHTHGTGAWRRRLYLDMTTHQGGAGPLDLASYTIPANLLGTSKGLHIRAALVRAGSDSKTVQLLLGATVLISFTGTTALDNVLDIYLFNTATNAQRISSIRMQADSFYLADYTTSAEDTTAALVLKFTGDSANITQVMFAVELIP